ncbi:MAG: hypothetical protein Fur0023_19710 [Bacteroidia bacterium]
MKKLSITILALVVFSKLSWCQSDTIRTATNVKIIGKNPGQKNASISQEDTLISTPNSVMVMKKKDYYLKKNITQREITDKGDSIIVTPSYIKVLRKKESSKR